MDDHFSEKKSKTNTLLIIFLILLGLVLAAVIGIFIFFNHYYSKTNFVKDKEELETAPTEPDEFETMAEVDESALADKLEQERKAFFERTFKNARTKKKNKTKEGDGHSVLYSENVYNLLLIGVDRRDKTWNGNSDAMILASINYETNTVTFTSFMRDTWVSIPGVGMRKMNAAFAVGNGPLLVQTMELNFGIAVDNYAWIDFDGMKAVIDTLGGVDITLTAKEGQYAGVAVPGDSALVHLNGQQALTYARDRTTSGWDYGRTQRQRNVIMAIVNKAKSGGISNLTSAANAVLPYITHNISETKLMSLILDLKKIVGFNFQEQRVPFDGLYTSVNQNLVPDYGATISRLYETIYAPKGE